MKKLLLLLLLPVLLFGQFEPDVMNVNITFPVMMENLIVGYECYYESRPQGQPMILNSGMTLVEARNLSGGITITSTPDDSFSYDVIANEYSFNFLVFGLNLDGDEIVHQVGFDRYFLRPDMAYGTLPLQQSIIDHNVYLNVTVDFE